MTWIIKETYANAQCQVVIYYLRITENGNWIGGWSTSRKECYRFGNREDALAVVQNLNNQGSSARLVKLKEKPKNIYIYPKIGTVFLDKGVTIKGFTVAHIVHSSEEDNQSLHTYDVSMGKGVWGNLSEYYRYLSTGDIEIIWKPES